MDENLGSGRYQTQFRSRHQPRRLQTLPSGTIEPNCVSIGFPDCRQSDAARAMQAEKDPTRFPAANKYSLRYFKGVFFQFVVLAYCSVNVSSQVLKVLDVHTFSVHLFIGCSMLET